MMTDVNEVIEGDSGEADLVLGLAQDLEIVDVGVEVARGNGNDYYFF